jgi:hypothetical protein
MTISVNGCSGKSYTFEGPYTNTDSLAESSGIYLILCKNGINNFDPIDVGESHNLKNRVETHDRSSCWSNNCNTQLFVAVLYTPHKQQPGRKEIEQDIRCNYNFPCGKK